MNIQKYAAGRKWEENPVAWFPYGCHLRLAQSPTFLFFFYFRTQ